MFPAEFKMLTSPALADLLGSAMLFQLLFNILISSELALLLDVSIAILVRSSRSWSREIDSMVYYAVMVRDSMMYYAMMRKR